MCKLFLTSISYRTIYSLCFCNQFNLNHVSQSPYAHPSSHNLAVSHLRLAEPSVQPAKWLVKLNVAVSSASTFLLS